MARQNYRRAAPAVVPAGVRAPHGDPYADYLAWIDQGRPPLGGSAAAKPEAGTVLLSEHVQVQELGALPELQNLLEPAKPSLWGRITKAFRRS